MFLTVILEGISFKHLPAEWFQEWEATKYSFFVVSYIPHP